MATVAEAFALLSKGVIVSIGSKRHHDIARFLSIDENFDMFDETVRKLGYRLIGENGYFYLAKEGRLDAEESERFVARHKQLIVAVAVLKRLIPLAGSGHEIRQTETVAEYIRKEDESLEEMMRFLFGEDDRKSRMEAFFKLLEQHYLIERIDASDKDRYKILQAFDYYVSVVEHAFNR